ncbi:phosphodiester glycosidase family protein [Paenibacillus caui]|uniref:phosphodiester glycosidase family protein n=1 Tax=Paenibacillus caui TaxID=2873927 RepID=UPI001F2F0EFF|nr:phosphodiester glycosidase family protein [Paenibacillus caui]
MRMKGKPARRVLSALLGMLLLFSVLTPYEAPVHAAEETALSIGEVLDSRSMELAPGAVYHWYDMKLARGLEKVHTVEFNPSNPLLELQAGTKGGKVYGTQGVTQMAAYADKEASRVVAGINGDFFDMNDHGTGVPVGLFMSGGKILNSADGDNGVFVLNEDGTARIGPVPKLVRTVTIQGKPSELSHINRYRSNDELVLYTSDYADTTKTTDLGDEVVLDVLEGDVQSGQTMRLKVSELRIDKGNTPLSPGKVVLSAQGTARTLLAPLQVGDEVTASFELEEGWRGAKLAMSGFMLMKDGAVLGNVPPAGVHPRTAVGIKADGSVLMLEIDGRAPGFSEGVDTGELGEIMKSMGVVNALNLDGGGSSTFAARLPGETEFKMLNRGSDGGERPTGNSLLLVNKASEGPAAKLVVRPNLERVLAGSSVAFTAAGVDAAVHPAAFEGPVIWQAEPALGTFDEDGRFTAGYAAGTAAIHAQAGALEGSGEVEVVNDLTALKFPDSEKAVDSGASVQLNVAALRNGQEIKADNRSFEWRVEGDIGTISPDGVFTAVDDTGKSGKIYVKYGDIETSMTVNVGTPPYVLENFENGLDRYLSSAGANYNTALASLTTEDEYVRFGNQALKLEYDFIGKVGTTGAYLQVASKDKVLVIPGYPSKISMWVYGDGSGNWLRGQMRDKNGAGGPTPLNLTQETVGVDWKGWKYVEANVPAGLTPPLTLDMPVRYMTTSKNPPVKGAGAIYVDEIRAVYGPVEDDIEPPVLKNMEPADGSVVQTGTPVIRAIGEDAGYDPQKSPGTTLIDPDKIFFHVDNMPVSHTLYPPEGRISYKPEIPLADGVHKAKIQIRDLSGNRAEKEWTFNVDTGSSKFLYDTPQEIYAGSTNTLDIKGFKTAGIHAGQIGFAFDTSKVDGLELVPGGKLTDSQVQADIDATAGKVLVKFSNLETAGLTDSDLLAQIRYHVRPDAEGSSTIAFTSGTISFTGTPGAASSFFGLPRESVIKHPLQLSWNDTGRVEGYPTTFSVVLADGTPAAGVHILADGTVVGVTDAGGHFTTDALTKSIKTYKLQAVKDSLYSSAMTFTVSKLAGTMNPYNISVTMGADPATSRGFTWHTHPNAAGTKVEIAERDGFTDFAQASAITVDGTDSLFSTYDLGTVRVHKAAVSGLKPGTEYVYRVGDGAGNYSVQGSFATASTNQDKVKFLFFGDSQASDQAGFDLWKNTLNQATADMPDADFIVHAGDMVDNGYKENEWNMWFAAAQDKLMNTTLVAAVGNHEVTGTSGNGDFLNHFNQPGNGLDSLKGSNFSFDYGDTHFAMLNSEYQYEEQKEWLRSDLAKTDKKWKVVLFHRGPYGSIYDTEIVRKEWVPVLDEFHVDLVLNGHDHIYLRNFMKDGAAAETGEGTAYVVGGSSGPKFYGLTRRDWTQFVDEEMTQMYVEVEIDKSSLSVVTKTVGGREVDRFVLNKPKVSIDPTKLDLTIGDQAKLNAKVEPDTLPDKTIVWSVSEASREGVVDVETQGTVTAKKPGTAVIKATHAKSGVFAESTVTVKDVKPPVTAVVYSTTPNEAGWFNRNVTLQLSASDDDAVKGITYRLTGAAEAEEASVDGSSAELSIDQEGITIIHYAAVDLSGNKEQEKELVIRLDQTKPVIDVTGAGSYTIDQKVVIECTASDTVSGVVYDPCASGPLVSEDAYVLGAGAHTITVQARDAAGNVTETPVTYEIVVDYDGLSRLTERMVEGPGKQGIVNALLVKLRHAEEAEQAGKEQVKQSSIAAYIEQVESLGQEGNQKILHPDLLTQFARML